MLTPWTRTIDPFYPVEGLLRGLEQLFSDHDRLPGVPRATVTGRVINCEYTDDGEAIHVRADVPGLTKDELTLDATATSLSFKGERKVDAPEGYRLLRRERPRLAFSQTVELPCRIDVDSVVARLHDGVLTIDMRKHEAERARNIAITAG